jgi:hypothetical protein
MNMNLYHTSSTAFRPTLGPTQPFSRGGGVKRQGREAVHSPLSSAEVKKSGVIPPLSNVSKWRSA